MACAVLDVPVPRARRRSFAVLRRSSRPRTRARRRSRWEEKRRCSPGTPTPPRSCPRRPRRRTRSARAWRVPGMARCRLEAVRARRRATPRGTLLGPRSRSSPDAARVTSAPPRGSDRPRDPSRPFAFADRPARISCRREDDDAARLAPPRDVSRASFKEQTHTCEVDAVSWRPRAVLGKAETPAETPEVAHIFPRHPGRQKSYGLVSDSAAGAAGLESRRPRLERTTARAGSRLLAPIVQLGKPTLGLGLRPRPRV